jgi:hypothetical protein
MNSIKIIPKLFRARVLNVEQLSRSKDRWLDFDVLNYSTWLHENCSLYADKGIDSRWQAVREKNLEAMCIVEAVIAGLLISFS